MEIVFSNGDGGQSITSESPTQAKTPEILGRPKIRDTWV